MSCGVTFGWVIVAAASTKKASPARPQPVRPAASITAAAIRRAAPNPGRAGRCRWGVIKEGVMTKVREILPGKDN